MQLHSLRSEHKRARARSVGRGGTRGKTSGRGGKGQTARAGAKIRPEIRGEIKKLPKRRGWGKNRARTVRRERRVYAPVNLAALERAYASGEVVSPATLLEKGLVRRAKGRAPAVKILGSGGLEKALVIRNCALSVSAREKLTAVGATVEPR